MCIYIYVCVIYICVYICDIYLCICIICGFSWWLSGKESACNAGGAQVQSMGWEDPLEKEMASHSSIFAWEIPWMEEPGGLQFSGLQKSQIPLGS